MTEFSIKRPWLVLALAFLITVFFASQFPNVKIDTDPENMLDDDDPTRLFHQLTKEDFSLYDFIAVGAVRQPTAFTANLLNRIYRITDEIEQIDGVIVDDIIAPSTVDDIGQGPGGQLDIKPLMPELIETDDDARKIFARIMDNPILRGKLASDDGQAIALFIPIESKHISYRVGERIREIVDRLGGGNQFHIAGLPLAEDQFGSEMFVQMAYGAPVSMMVIFLLMFLFFRNVRIIIAPMVVAMMSVIWTMGLLILTGNTVHIMSSMIPVFLMPIAVLDSIHIISEFQDNFNEQRSKYEAIQLSIKELYRPMLFTTLTTVAGFASLALTPIPPVRVFGIFVAFGVFVAWFLSMTLNPAMSMLISTKTLRTFGRTIDDHGPLTKLLHTLRAFSWRQYKAIVTVSTLIIIIAIYGLTLITVNDNPVKWFKKSHPIRIADEVMNRHLAGTYMNYLIFDSDEEDAIKSPVVVRYIEAMQQELEKDEYAGAVTGVTDIIKKVRYELFDADSSKLSLPETQNEIAQMLFLYEMSGGDPDDLFKFVTPTYDRANLWVQMKEGDNIAVSQVVERGNRYLAEHPPPEGLSIRWAGLPYINIQWQTQMVTGMRNSLAGSAVVVFLMMIFLFRSIRWGFVSMLPFTFTIAVIYAYIGFTGKPYDMPVAVLSSLSLGLSIDFAIHYIQRKRMIFARSADFRATFDEIFEGTSRAIVRNIFVIAIGFLPMLFSSLVPYITVGAFFLSIMLISGLVTLLLLPAISRAFTDSLFPGSSGETK